MLHFVPKENEHTLETVDKVTAYKVNPVIKLIVPKTKLFQEFLKIKILGREIEKLAGLF